MYFSEYTLIRGNKYKNKPQAEVEIQLYFHLMNSPSSRQNLNIFLTQATSFCNTQ